MTDESPMDLSLEEQDSASLNDIPAPAKSEVYKDDEFYFDFAIFKVDHLSPQFAPDLIDLL